MKIQIKQDILLWLILGGLDISNSLFISLIKFNAKHWYKRIKRTTMNIEKAQHDITEQNTNKKNI